MGQARHSAASDGRLTSPISDWLDGALLCALLLFAVCAPHSIAATQIAWGLGLLVWLVRLACRPRPRLWRTPIDYALLAFFNLTFLSAILSYAPDISIGKLRAASLFTIIYLVAENVRTRREVRWLALVLVASCMINVVYSITTYARGRGVKIEELRAESPLARAGLRAGDTVVEVDGRPLRSPEQLESALSTEEFGATQARLRVYRVEAWLDFELARGASGAMPAAGMSATETDGGRLGITRWSRGRDERAAGFYGHYITYAEVLQLVASLALGLLVAHGRRWSRSAGLLAAAVAGLVFVLVLTVTRASLAGFVVSAFVIVATGAASRRSLLAVTLVSVPLVVAGLLILQQKRQIGFLDRREGSTAWRLMVYGESLSLLVREPRHLLVGVGMDALKRHYREWGLFDKGRQNIGHLHSTPLQIAVERGLPALAAWLALVFVYARTLWRLARRRTHGLRDGGRAVDEEWMMRGVALGALGGLAGFLTSGLVHWNLGDSEVAMVFYFLMGLALAIERLSRENKEAPAGEELSERERRVV